MRAAAPMAPISASLQRQLDAAEQPISFLVILDDQLDAAALLRERDLRRDEKSELIYKTLTAHALRSQAGLRQWLDARGIAYRPFYIVNMIEVTGDSAVVNALRQRSDVRRIAANPTIRQSYLAQPARAQSSAWAETAATWLQMYALPAARSIEEQPYGLAYTHADDVWAMGYQGQGIVLASQDTGVQWDHPALQAQYRGWDATTETVEHAYHWYDAWGDTGRPFYCDSDPQTPCDDNGHGTHTVGTMLGDDRVNSGPILGMAPQAQWIGCRNMETNYGTPASYTACFEFFLAPYPQGGDPFTDGRPDLAPHIINNSWGCPPSEGCDADSLRQIVETVRAAGQMVVSSAGNKGAAGCGTVEDPIAIYDAAFSVGAHDAAGNIAGFSSRGPVTVDGSGRLKPDITAPGVAVYSSYVNNLYGNLQGTSMASPHVAGAVALLWSAVPDLIGEIDRTEQILIKSADPVPFAECGAELGEVPNPTFGYGRLNVAAAVQMALHPDPVTVTVHDEAGNPMANAPVVLTDQRTGYTYESMTNAQGEAQFSAIYRGSYDVSSPAAGATFPEPVITVVHPMVYLPWIERN